MYWPIGEVHVLHQRTEAPSEWLHINNTHPQNFLWTFREIYYFATGDDDGFSRFRGYKRVFKQSTQSKGHSCNFTIIDSQWMKNRHVASLRIISSVSTSSIHIIKNENKKCHVVNDMAKLSWSAIFNCYKEVQPQFCPLHTREPHKSLPTSLSSSSSSSPATTIGPGNELSGDRFFQISTHSSNLRSSPPCISRKALIRVPNFSLFA